MMYDEILETFREEGQDLIDRCRDQIELLRSDPLRGDLLKEVLRHVHTIKGGAGTCELTSLKDVAHKLESWIDPVKNEEEALTIDHLDKFQAVVDLMESLIMGEDIENPIGQLEAILQIASSTSVKDNIDKTSASSEDPTLGGGFEIFDESASESIVEPANTSQNQAPERQKSLEPKASKSASSEVLRIPLERVEKNFDIISEIFLTRNQMQFFIEQKRKRMIKDDEFFQKWEALDSSLRKSIGQLEHIAMSMRMTPVKSLFRRMEKTVRDYSRNSTKKIKVDLQNQETEIDKKILDSLAEPLIHLVRNAMDHGIEDLENRLMVGKSDTATITLSAVVYGNQVELSVRDDGKGIDDAKILESARNKGVDVSHVQSKEEALNLIFASGFSTKDSASDISGRGVGMDAVKKYVDEMGGEISISTEVGVGTTFTLRLGLGLTVLPALIASLNDQKFAILNSDILETVRVDPKQIVENGEGSLLQHKGEFIPCLNLSEHLFLTAKKKQVFLDFNETKFQKRIPVCIIEREGRLVAIRVDRLHANTEIVIKPVPNLAPSFPYTNGVAILATGEPAFVISLPRICDYACKKWMEVSHAAA